MAKVGKNNQEATVAAPVADTGEQAALGTADVDVAGAPVGKDSLPTPPAATEAAADVATPGKPDDRDVKPAVLRVVSKREGFRRAGFQFGSTPVDLDEASLTAAQLDQLEDEPLLTVTRISDE